MFTEQNTVAIAKRENNNKRKYLVINRLQGKHIAVRPSKAFEMFDALAEIIKKEYQNEKLLLIGFAETATAIGAEAAVRLGVPYMHTTREPIEGVEYLFFMETHSHATEQKLIKTDLDKIINDIDRIIFIEDEITTGNTILQIVELIRRTYSRKISFSAASLLNGMREVHINEYQKKKIDIDYLIKTDHTKYEKLAEKYKGDGKTIDAYSDIMKLPKNVPDRVKKYFNGATKFGGRPFKYTENLTFSGYKNARRLIDSSRYEASCNALFEQLSASVKDEDIHTLLVMGTEEFMYPALYVAEKFEEMGYDVRCHSTSRTPISESSEDEYPVHVRYELRSMYEEQRKIFVYDIGRYDKVIIITDAQNPTEAGVFSLMNAVAMCGNSNVCFVRWCENEKAMSCNEVMSNENII